jgi:hypothetical protein
MMTRYFAFMVDASPDFGGSFGSNPYPFAAHKYSILADQIQFTPYLPYPNLQVK